MLLLATPALSDERSLYVLRVGAFQEAQPADALEQVYRLWGLDRWDDALERGANLPEARLLLISAAQNSGRAGLVPALLEGLKVDAPGARGSLQRFLLASYRAQQDWRLRDLSQKDLEQRAREAFAHLDGLRVDDDLVAHGLPELPLAAEEIAEFWVPRLGPTAIELYRLSFDRILDYQPSKSWNEAGIYYQIMALSHLVSVEATLQVRIRGLISEDEALKRLMALGLRVDEVLRESSEDPVSRGFMAVSSTRVHRALANLVAQRSPGSISAVEAAFLTDQLNAAYLSAHKQGSPKVLVGVQTDLLLALWAMQRPGWETTMEDFCSALIPQWEKRRDRGALIVAYASLGRLRSTQGRNAEAIVALSRAIELLEAAVTESGGKAVGERLRREWGELYELLARLQLAVGQGEAAAATLDRLRQLDTAARFNLRDLRSENPQVQAVAALQSRLGGLEAQNSDPALVASTRTEYYAALEKLQNTEPGFLRLSVRPDFLARLPSVLPADTAVVQLFPTQERLYLFVATKEGLRIRQVPIGKAALEHDAARFRRAVMDFSRSPGSFSWTSDAGRALLEPMLSLGQAILIPLQPDLADKKVVAFVPTGQMSYFPLQALALPGPRFLIEEKQVVILPKAADLDLLDRAPAVDRGVLVALGDPDGTLPSARLEVLALKKMFPKAQTYLGPAATLDSLRALPAGTSYLHFATHGVLNAREATRSYLLLSDRPLGVLDIAGMSLGDVRLVTLSACQTALAERSPEMGANLFSLADAFGFAGSPSLLASLWKVDDAATSSLMVSFYEGLRAGQSRGLAFQAAQVRLLRAPATSHPFYWSAFELLGDWR